MKILYVILILFFSFNNFIGNAQTSDLWDGTSDTTWYNSTDTVFQLTTAKQLAGLAVMVNNGNTFQGKTIELMNNIDLGGALDTPLYWMPIGYNYANNCCFSGFFDGNSFTVENLHLQDLVGDTLNVGLFGCSNRAVISNIIINNAFFSLNQDSKYIPSRGILVGNCSYSQIVNCHIKAIMNCYDCAGIAGQISYSSISYCSFNGKIEGDGNGIAGIAGTVRNSIVNNCMSHAIIKGNKFVGGIAAISSYSNIFNNVVMGACEVSYTYSGGIIGCSYYDTIENNFAITSQIGYGVSEIELLSIGGLFGDISNSNINNCYIIGGVIKYPSYTGGIAGFGQTIKMENSYAATYINEEGELRGSIAGLLDGSTIQNVFMDNNIGAFDGVGNNYMGNGQVADLFTDEMTTGNSFGLQDSVGFYPTQWVYEEGLYPQLDVFVNHPDTVFRHASLLSVIPVFLGDQTANQVTSDFKVSRLHGVSWSSSAEDIIRVEGENAIVTPINQDTMVVLTVTLNELEKEFYFKVLKGSSIKEVNPQHISIYPNPANTILYIDNGDIAMQELLLYDVSGRLLKRVSVHVNTTSLDVSDLQNGIYLIKITTRDAAFVRKIQVVR
jgi:hypothetical protein